MTSKQWKKIALFAVILPLGALLLLMFSTGPVMYMVERYYLNEHTQVVVHAPAGPWTQQLERYINWWQEAGKRHRKGM